MSKKEVRRLNPDKGPQQQQQQNSEPQNSQFLQWVQKEATGTVEYGKEVLNTLSALPWVGPLFGTGSAAVSASQGKTGEAATSAGFAMVPFGEEAELGGAGMRLTEGMSKNAFRKLAADIAENGLKDKVIQYVEVGGGKYVVNGNNRLMAAEN